VLASLSAALRPYIKRRHLLREWLDSGVTYNELSHRFRQNPYPGYKALRQKDPVHWSRLYSAWVLTRHGDIEMVMRDHRRFSNDPRNHLSAGPQPALDGDLDDRGSLTTFLDPPDHTRLRSAVSEAFAPAAIEALEGRVRNVTVELLDRVDDAAGFDAMRAIAHPLPLIVITELLGISESDRQQVQAWAAQRICIVEPTITARQRRAAYAAGKALNDYHREVINQRRKEPRDDLISALVRAEDEGDTLTENEIVVMSRLLIVAGTRTTTNLIGNGLLALLRHPGEMQILRDQPDMLPAGVEELLRYDNPIQMVARYVIEDVELSGRQLRRGQALLLLIGAGNRDPEAFSKPDELDITRKEGGSLSFGRGVHHCLGSILARIEARIVFDVLFERYESLHLLTDQPAFTNATVIRGLTELPVGLKSGNAN